MPSARIVLQAFGLARREALEAAERAFDGVLELVDDGDVTVSDAARELDVERQTIYNRLAKRQERRDQLSSSTELEEDPNA